MYKALKSNWRLYHLPEADVDDKKVKYILESTNILQRETLLI
ncbi:hypothetical protein [Companilactobacillus paralimentarius]|nr:hypothetical protein [Companilactobacillus paralimentarius]